jgi:hypothetical protein
MCDKMPIFYAELLEYTHPRFMVCRDNMNKFNQNLKDLYIKEWLNIVKKHMNYDYEIPNILFKRDIIDDFVEILYGFIQMDLGIIQDSQLEPILDDICQSDIYLWSECQRIMIQERVVIDGELMRSRIERNQSEIARKQSEIERLQSEIARKQSEIELRQSEIELRQSEIELDESIVKCISTAKISALICSFSKNYSNCIARWQKIYDKYVNGGHKYGEYFIKFFNEYEQIFQNEHDLEEVLSEFPKTERWYCKNIESMGDEEFKKKYWMHK